VTNTGGKKSKMKKLLKNKKALSPVVAAIILIAVTVAVSIAVAAWMGSMTFTFMETEEMRITSVDFTATSATVNVRNTGTTDVIVIAGSINGVDQDLGTAITVAAGSATATGNEIVLTGTFAEGVAYNIEILTSKGNTFSYTGTAY
jgi:flagellin-like protein